MPPALARARSLSRLPKEWWPPRKAPRAVCGAALATREARSARAVICASALPVPPAASLMRESTPSIFWVVAVKRVAASSARRKPVFAACEKDCSLSPTFGRRSSSFSSNFCEAASTLLTRPIASAAAPAGVVRRSTARL